MTTEQHAAFTGSIPALYDRFLVPVLFEPFAKAVAERVTIERGDAVLEVACGTGVVTRELAIRLPVGASITATDLNGDMVAYAREAVTNVRGISWEQADAAALPFEDGQFASVVSQFGLMFVPDRQEAVTEARRVLKPGGVHYCTVWAGRERNPFAAIADDTISAFFPDDPPTFYKVPFSMDDEEALRSLAEGAGFEDVALERLTADAESPSAREFARGLVEGNPGAIAIEERGTVPLDEIVEAVEARLASEFGDDPLRTRLEAVLLTAR